MLSADASVVVLVLRHGLSLGASGAAEPILGVSPASFALVACTGERRHPPLALKVTAAKSESLFQEAFSGTLEGLPRLRMPMTNGDVPDGRAHAQRTCNAADETLRRLEWERSEVKVERLEIKHA